MQRSLSIPEPALRVLNEAVSTTGTKQGGTTTVVVKVPAPTSTTTPLETSKQLQKLMLRIKGEVIAEDGRSVNYAKFKSSKLYSKYEDQAMTLRSVDLSKMNSTQKKVFFINIYNALTIHGLAHIGKLPESVLNIQLFWQKTAYNIGGHILTLDDIEHGILRGNRPHPAGGSSPPFKEGDPRLNIVIQKFDPRVHFALVCGAKSCPAIQVYTEENLEAALDGATRNFCEENIRIHTMQKEIYCSQLFQWYRLDFGDNDVDAIRWTLPYLSQKKRPELSILLDLLEHQGMVDIIYNTWDWSINKMK